MSQWNAINTTRRGFLMSASLAAAATAVQAEEKKGKGIAGFDQTDAGALDSKLYQLVSDHVVKVGIAGYGACGFGECFGFRYHPNAVSWAATDLVPERRDELARRVHAQVTYNSCEEMIEKDKDIEAVFIATDAPSHVRLAIMALNHGLNVASCVPAIFGEDQLDLIPELIDAVKRSGKIYCMFETSAYHADLFAMNEIYKRGDCGKLVYTEGEYYHWGAEGIPSYKGWRIGLPPQWYPTHSNAYYTLVVPGGHFTDVECVALPSNLKTFQPSANRYKNPFANETAFFKTGEGGSARMNVFWDMPNAAGEQGRWFCEKGYTGFLLDTRQGAPSFLNKEGKLAKLPYVPLKYKLPPRVVPGGHGGSHGYLMDNFVTSVLLNRAPRVDVYAALNTTVPGIYAHRSAMKDGEHLKIPYFHA